MNGEEKRKCKKTFFHSILYMLHGLFFSCIATRTEPTLNKFRLSHFLLVKQKVDTGMIWICVETIDMKVILWYNNAQRVRVT